MNFIDCSCNSWCDVPQIKMIVISCLFSLCVPLLPGCSPPSVLFSFLSGWVLSSSYFMYNLNDALQFYRIRVALDQHCSSFLLFLPPFCLLSILVYHTGDNNGHIKCVCVCVCVCECVCVRVCVCVCVRWPNLLTRAQEVQFPLGQHLCENTDARWWINRWWI